MVRTLAHPLLFGNMRYEDKEQAIVFSSMSSAAAWAESVLSSEVS